MTITSKHLRGLLAEADKDWTIYGEPEVGLHPGLFSGKGPGADDFHSIEPLSGYNLHLASLAPALAAEVLRLRRALEKIADGNPTVDSPEADAQLSMVIARAALEAGQ